MTVVVDVLIAVGVVVGVLVGAFILVIVLALVFVALAEIPGVARLGRAIGEGLGVLVIFAVVVPLLLLGFGVLLIFVGGGIFLIVVGSGIGDGGQVRWGTIVGGAIIFLLGLFYCWGVFVDDRKSDSRD
jgi:hypothetical protein